jgi:hypothetical protein
MFKIKPFIYLFLINSFTNFTKCEGIIPQEQTEVSYTSKIIGISLFTAVVILCVLNNKSMPKLENIEFDWEALTPLEIPIRMTLEESNKCQSFTLFSGKIINIPISDIHALLNVIRNMQAENVILPGNKIGTKIFISSQNYYIELIGNESITLPLTATDGVLRILHTDLINFYSQLLIYVN